MQRQADNLICYCRQTFTHSGGLAVTSQLAATIKKRRKIDLPRMQLTGTSGRRSVPSSERTTSTTSVKSNSNTRVATRVASLSNSTMVGTEGIITVTSLSSSSTLASSTSSKASRVTGSRATGVHLCRVGTSSSPSSLITTREVTTTTISNFSSTTIRITRGVGFETSI